MATKTKPAKAPKPTANGQPHVPSGDIMTLDETATYLRVAAPGLLPMAERGEIPARFVAGEWRFSKQALLAWLSEPTLPPTEPKKGSYEAISRHFGIGKDDDDMEDFLAILAANRKELNKLAR